MLPKKRCPDSASGIAMRTMQIAVDDFAKHLFLLKAVGAFRKIDVLRSKLKTCREKTSGPL